MVGSCQGQKGCESRSELLGEFSVAPVPAWHTWSVAQKDFSGLMDKFDFPLLRSNVILEVLSEGKSHKSLYNIISLLFSSKPTQFKIQTNKNPLQNPGQLILSNQTTTFSTDNKFIQTFFVVSGRFVSLYEKYISDVRCLFLNCQITVCFMQCFWFFCCCFNFLPSSDVFNI